jgi:hypothetical protein
MLRYSLVLLAGLAVTAPASASWAEKLFEETSKDFGPVARGPQLVHHFRLVNNTGTPVTITGIRVSCGCTSAYAIKGTLQPGEATAVVATMDSNRFLGAKAVTIYVTFGQPSFDEVRLLVQAYGRSDFAVTPDTLAFGRIPRGAPQAVRTTVVFYGASDVRITEIKPESSYIKPEFKEIRRQDGEVAYEVTARVRNDIPAGKWFTDVWVKTTNPSLPQLRVPLTVEVESALTAAPDAIAVGAVKAGTETEQRVVVRGVAPFKITSIDGTDNILSIKDNTPEAKETHVLTIKLKAEAAGDLARTLHIHTDLPQDGNLDLPISARIMP